MELQPEQAALQNVGRYLYEFQPGYALELTNVERCQIMAEAQCRYGDLRMEESRIIPMDLAVGGQLFGFPR